LAGLTVELRFKVRGWSELLVGWQGAGLARAGRVSRVLNLGCPKWSQPSDLYQQPTNGQQSKAGQGWVKPYRTETAPPTVKLGRVCYCTPQIKIFAKVKAAEMSDLV